MIFVLQGYVIQDIQTDDSTTQHIILISHGDSLRYRVMLSGQAGKLCVSKLRTLLNSRLTSSSATAYGRIPDGFGKIKEKQKFFNLDNGLR